MNNIVNVNNKKKIIIITFVFIVIALLLIIVFNNNDKAEVSTTGHFYGKPLSTEDIYGIEIVYNNGKDYIYISSDDIINYFTYDENGNSVDNVVNIDTHDIINYIYTHDLKYLNKYEHVDNEKWSLTIYGPGMHCLKSSKKDEPKWLKEILKEINAEENGYLSEK